MLLFINFALTRVNESVVEYAVCHGEASIGGM